MRRAARTILLAAPCFPSPRVHLRGPSLAECSSCLSTISPRRLCCCAGCHPVVSTAVDTHRVKPSSGLSLRPPLLPALSLSLLLTIPTPPARVPNSNHQVATLHCSAWRRGSKPASFGGTRPSHSPPPTRTESNTGECATRKTRKSLILISRRPPHPKSCEHFQHFCTFV